MICSKISWKETTWMNQPPMDLNFMEITSTSECILRYFVKLTM